jgi:hypothetical protein
MYSMADNLQQAANNIQTNCEVVGKNLAKLGLKLCPEKTKIVVFCKNKPVRVAPIRVGNRRIEYNKEMKILGITMTKTLNWKPHVRTISQKVSPYINFLRSIASQKWGGHPNAMLTIYKSCIRSIIEYGSYLFDNAPDSTLIALDRLQWKCLRICTGMFRTTHTKTLEVVAGIEPLGIRRLKTASRFVSKRVSIENNPALASTSNNTTDRNTSLESAMTTLAPRLQNCHKNALLPCFKYNREITLTKINMDTRMHYTSQNMNRQEIQQEYSRIVNTQYNDCIILGTDGSKDGPSVGIAVVGDFTPIVTLQPSSAVSIMIAELMAIYHALYIDS